MLDRDVVGKSHFGGFGDEDEESDDEEDNISINALRATDFETGF